MLPRRMRYALSLSEYDLSSLFSTSRSRGRSGRTGDLAQFGRGAGAVAASKVALGGVRGPNPTWRKVLDVGVTPAPRRRSITCRSGSGRTTPSRRG